MVIPFSHPKSAQKVGARVKNLPLERHVSVQNRISPVSSAEMATDSSEQLHSDSEGVDENSEKTLDSRRKSYLTPHYSFRHGGPTCAFSLVFHEFGGFGGMIWRVVKVGPIWGHVASHHSLG